ncbi:sensor histidine kinase [Pedobacter sp. L105]|uniref:sensor histidine kinase n=1 Tax=Pedobacter sp. L105 TaxID=1641871 RepID=UPI00131D7607|nr:sensor histidine kinase [Pedobacter sp. L105]
MFLLNYSSANFTVNLWRIPLFVVLEIFVYTIISLFITFLLNKYLYHDSSQEKLLNYQYVPTSIYRGTYFVLYGTGYYFLINYVRKKEKTLTQAIENEKLQNEVLRAEQDFLRAQINPHLLFNTLSFIKYAAKKKPEEADEAVMRLSSIMSFALDNNSQSILLNKEIDQVENIIGLNQLRYNRTLNIKFKQNLENDQATIIPIILLTLAENVFKHGNLLDGNHPAEINVEATQEYVLLQTRNLPSQDNKIKSHHTGLTNMRSRLEQFYKDKYHFDYGQDGDIFKVDIKIYL